MQQETPCQADCLEPSHPGGPQWVAGAVHATRQTATGKDKRSRDCLPPTAYYTSKLWNSEEEIGKPGEIKNTTRSKQIQQI